MTIWRDITASERVGSQCNAILRREPFPSLAHAFFAALRNLVRYLGIADLTSRPRGRFMGSRPKLSVGIGQYRFGRDARPRSLPDIMQNHAGRHRDDEHEYARR